LVEPEDSYLLVGDERIGDEHGKLAAYADRGLDGAKLVARPYRDLARFQAAAELLLTGFRAGAATTSTN
jgi:hypothetical protein